MPLLQTPISLTSRWF